MPGLGRWVHEHLKALGIWGSVALALLGLVLVFTGEAEAVGLGLLAFSAVTVVAFTAVELKGIGDASLGLGQEHPVRSPGRSPGLELPGPVHIDTAGHLMAGDEAALLAYVVALRRVPVEQRSVEVSLASPLEGTPDPELRAAVETFESCATTFVRGGVRFPWGPPRDESVAKALQALWNSFGAEADVVAWFAWPPGHPEQRVVCPVPATDRRLEWAGAVVGQPIHIQAVPSDLVWERFAPLALRSALETDSGPGLLPVSLDQWRVASADPGVPGNLATTTPLVEGVLATSEGSTDTVW